MFRLTDLGFDNEIHSRQTLLTHRIGKSLRHNKAFHDRRSESKSTRSPFLLMMTNELSFDIE